MSALDVIEGRAQWTVIHGDNAAVLPTLPDGSVDVVLQDPPYEAEAHTTQRRLKGATVGDLRIMRDAPIEEFPPITDEVDPAG